MRDSVCLMLQVDCTITATAVIHLPTHDVTVVMCHLRNIMVGHAENS